MRSKPLKIDFQKDKAYWKYKLSEWWYAFWPVKWYYDLEVLISRSKRLYKWAKFMWTNWDFDALTIYPLLEYKLKRVQHNLINGNAVHEVGDLKALKIALKLAKRLSNDHHENKYHEWHDKKWGKLKTWLTPMNDGTGNYLYNSSRGRAVTIEDKERERQDYLAMWENYGKWRKRDEKLFFAILQKYIPVWWD